MDMSIKNKDIHYHLLRSSINLFGKPPAELMPEEMDRAQSQAVRECELEQLVLESQEARDVHIPESVLKEALKQVESGYPDNEAYLNELEENGLNQNTFRQAVDRELRVNAVLDRVSSRAARVSEVDCMLFYYMHKDRFSAPETRTVRHILITVNDDFAENTRDSVETRMQQIRKRLLSKPKRFSEQAVKHSECPTALNGGLIGKVPEGQLYKELDELLFSMQQGEISDVVESEIGFHILYCEEIHPAGPVGFRQAEEKIREKLTRRRKRMCQKSWLSELKQNSAQGDDGND